MAARSASEVLRQLGERMTRGAQRLVDLRRGRERTLDVHAPVDRAHGFLDVRVDHMISK